MPTVIDNYPVSNRTGFHVNSEGELLNKGESVESTMNMPEAQPSLELWDFLAEKFRNFSAARTGGKFSLIECCAMPSVIAPDGKGSEVAMLEFEFSTRQSIQREDRVTDCDPNNYTDIPGEAEVLEALGLLQVKILEQPGAEPLTHHVMHWGDDRPNYYSFLLTTKAKDRDFLLPVADLVSKAIMADPCLNKVHERIG